VLLLGVGCCASGVGARGGPARVLGRTTQARSALGARAARRPGLERSAGSVRVAPGHCCSVGVGDVVGAGRVIAVGLGGVPGASRAAGRAGSAGWSRARGLGGWRWVRGRDRGEREVRKERWVECRVAAAKGAGGKGGGWLGLGGRRRQPLGQGGAANGP
jgi:hypothetical protein